jgi:hypothetical protein
MSNHHSSKGFTVRNGYGQLRAPGRIAVGLIATAAFVSATVLINSPAAFASVDTTGSAMDVATTLAGPGTTITGASWVSKPNDVVDPTSGYHASPDGVSDAPIAGFPTVGSKFAILTTGDAHLAPNGPPSTTGGASVNLFGASVRGDTDFDVSILKVDFSVGTRMNCLSFDFRFLSEEYPKFVGGKFNDAFIAELDTSDWKTSGSMILAPHNFAFDPANHVISINATGNTSMSPSPSDTIYSGATPVLTATTPVTVGDHSLYLSIFDQGDHLFDSAVFLDNLIIGHSVTNSQCAPGAAPKIFALGLTPKTKSLTVGDTHTVTANVTDLDPAPVDNAKVLFNVSGANTATGTAMTDANGNVTFSYQGKNPGTDTITACYDVQNSGTCDKGDAFNNAAADWVAAPPVATSSPTGGLLPITGSPIDLFAGAGVVLLIAGVVTLLLLRRRRVIADAYVSPTSVSPSPASPADLTTGAPEVTAAVSGSETVAAETSSSDTATETGDSTATDPEPSGEATTEE